MGTHLQALETGCFSAEREWTVDGIPVLTASVSLPRPLDRTSRVGRRIDRFYQLQGRSYFRYCENWLFPEAAAAYRQALCDSAPLPCYTARLTYRITCNGGGLWSLHTDTRECAGGRPVVLRRGDTWDLRTGYPVGISALFPKRFPIRKTLLRTAAEEIRRQEAAGVAKYHDKWPQQLGHSFNRENFTITDQGLCFFWQMHAIAPAAEGIPSFFLPFSSDGCRWPGLPTAPEPTGRDGEGSQSPPESTS